MAYNMMQSTSGMTLKNDSVSVSYGSATLQGFLWKDYACLQPLNLASHTNSGTANLVNSTFLAGAESRDAKGYRTAD